MKKLVLLLLLSACSGATSHQADSARPGRADAGPCAKFNVYNAVSYSDCKIHCRDDKNSRDGSCNNDGNCLQASGIKMEQCMQFQCEDGKKAAKAAGCFAD
jgi:hypothetical protein